MNRFQILWIIYCLLGAAITLLVIGPDVASYPTIEERLAVGFFWWVVACAVFGLVWWVVIAKPFIKHEEGG